MGLSMNYHVGVVMLHNSSLNLSLNTLFCQRWRRISRRGFLPNKQLTVFRHQFLLYWRSSESLTTLIMISFQEALFVYGLISYLITSFFMIRIVFRRILSRYWYPRTSDSRIRISQFGVCRLIPRLITMSFASEGTRLLTMLVVILTTYAFSIARYPSSSLSI